jgi:hypothetical protein
MLDEGLIRGMYEAKTFRVFKGVRVGKSLYVFHIVFVDDVILLCDGTRRDA